MAYIGAIIGAIGTAASIGSQAYAASQAGGGFVGAPPIKFTPIDVAGAQQGAIDISKMGYDLSDQDMATRFPGLVAGNKAAISDAYKQLTGPLDPNVQNDFMTRGIESSLGATGAGNSMAGIGGAGTASGNRVAVNLANNVLAKQDEDRSFQDTLIAANPGRSIGITGSQAADLSAYNTQEQNRYNYQLFSYQTQKDAADNAGGGF